MIIFIALFCWFFLMLHLNDQNGIIISANMDILEYIIIIEVNVSQAIFLDQIRSSLELISSLHIDNSTEIESVNITTGKKKYYYTLFMYYYIHISIFSP